MLTWSIFERRFSGDPSIVGRQIHLNGKPYTVVGVLPKDFAYPDSTVQVWVPYQAAATPEELRHHDWHRATLSLAFVLRQPRHCHQPSWGRTISRTSQYLNAPVAEDVAPRA